MEVGLTFILGFAQVDNSGKINVSKFDDNFVGCGGFIDIVQNTRKVIFCGCFNAKGLRLNYKIKLIIKSEGSIKKFIKKLIK